jgi:hypothetical protein
MMGVAELGVKNPLSPFRLIPRLDLRRLVFPKLDAIDRVDDLVLIITFE